MHTDICDLVPEPVYKGLLKDRDPHAPRPAFRPEPEYPVALYDTGGEPQARAQKPKKTGRSRYNEYHAGLAIALAKLVLADLPNECRKPEYIGIMTPIRHSATVLRSRSRGRTWRSIVGLGRCMPTRGSSSISSSLTSWSRQAWRSRRF